MPKHSKRFRAATEAIDRAKRHGLAEAVEALVSLPAAKFDETVELHVRTGADPTNQDQQVRGIVTLPHGTGKELRVIVFAAGDAAQEARDAGAIEVGGDDLAVRIRGGWLDFDAAVATPENMRIIGPLGRILGPRGLMPNARAGTVTDDVGRVVGELRAGRVEFRLDRLANIHVAVGKLGMGRDRILNNVGTVLDAIVRARPDGMRANFIEAITLASTMSPGISLDPVGAQQEATQLAA